MKKKNKKKNSASSVIKALFVVLSSLLALGSLLVRWATAHFGNIGMDEILFTLNMPLDGSTSSFMPDLIKTVIGPWLIILLAEILIFYVFSGKGCREYVYKLAIHTKKKDRQITVFPISACRNSMKFLWASVVLGVWTVLLFQTADQAFAFSDFVHSQLNQSYLIEEEYVDPKSVALKFPDKKRNLIWILMESAESSTQDRENGGLFDVNYTPEMTRLARENVSFSHSDKIEGAAVAPACGWTVAGMVAQFGGLPLKLYTYDDYGIDNDMGNYKSFLPGMMNLGDLLEAQGYHNTFMLGSDIKFGGRDKLMGQHGSYEIFDYYAAIESGKIPPDYYVWWGYEDQKLYEYAKEKLTQLAAEDEPFHLCCLTVDTHQPRGWVCPLCREEHDSSYGNVWSCASRQVSDFVAWIQEQPFYENTTIIVTGDHCSMAPDFYEGVEYDKHHGSTERKVYNAIIHSAVEPVQEEGRLFTTMDMFPTALAALGVEIEGNRLALGTNLFSDKETLAEQYGYERLFDELNQKSMFYNEMLLYQREPKDGSAE